MKSNEPIYVTRPYLPPLSEYHALLQKLWESRVLTNGGVFHQQLERELCATLGVDHISLFTNGTIALVSTLQALGVKGEVITTPYSFVATSHALLWNGIKPVFVDIDYETLNIDSSKIEAAITGNTTAILAVHVYGQACNTGAIEQIAIRHNLKVIYDAAHAFGVNDEGGSILRHGDASVLSFHATKVFNTVEGGAVISNSAALKRQIDYLKNFGFVDEETVVEPGINGKMNEFTAALGTLQLKYIDHALSQRSEIDGHYRRLLRGVSGLRIIGESVGDRTSNYSYFPIMVGPEFRITRDDLYRKLKSHQVYARRYFYPLITDFPMYQDTSFSGNRNLGVAERAAKEVLCLPIYPGMTFQQIERIAHLIVN